MTPITNQMIFDAAWQKFVVEGAEPAVEFCEIEEIYSCCYYTEDGRKCAVGLVLPETIAKSLDKNVSLGNILHNMGGGEHDYRYLFDYDVSGNLQNKLHDGLINKKTGQWDKRFDIREEYTKVAQKYKLTIPVKIR